jgi:hypothetical protein
MDQPIVLRLTLEHMQWSIMQALYPREAELQECIEAVVKRAFESFDFEAEIERETLLLLRRKVREEVEREVLSMLSQKDDPPIRAFVREEVERQLKGGK